MSATTAIALLANPILLQALSVLAMTNCPEDDQLTYSGHIHTTRWHWSTLTTVSKLTPYIQMVSDVLTMISKLIPSHCYKHHLGLTTTNDQSTIMLLDVLTTVSKMVLDALTTVSKLILSYYTLFQPQLWL
ncbi:hypothetical protein V8B97DRAFT_1917776 [Scleroderma yunnanense]